MDYTTESQIKQVEYSEKCAVQECLLLPSALFGFHNTATTVEQTKSGRDVFVLYGELYRVVIIILQKSVLKSSAKAGERTMRNKGKRSTLLSGDNRFLGII